MTKLSIIKLIFSYSQLLHCNPELALAIAQTESNLNQAQIGSFGEIGLFQVLPKYSKHSVSQLKNIKINIMEGIQKLKYAELHCKHKKDLQWIICYNVGISGGNKIKHPKLFPYYVKVIENYYLLKERRFAEL